MVCALKPQTVLPNGRKWLPWNVCVVCVCVCVYVCLYTDAGARAGAAAAGDGLYANTHEDK